MNTYSTNPGNKGAGSNPCIPEIGCMSFDFHIDCHVISIILQYPVFTSSHLTCVGISSEVHIQSRAKEAEAQKLATMLSTTTGNRLELEIIED